MTWIEAKTMITKMFFKSLTGLLMLLAVGVAHKRSHSASPIEQQYSDSTEIWRQKGFSAKQQGNIDKALHFYRKILEQDPKDYDATLAVARLYFTKGEYDPSLKYYDRIYQRDNKDAEALNGLGRCYRKLGQDKKAIRYYKKAMKISSDFMKPRWDLAEIYLEKGELNKAHEIYKNILQKDEGHAKALAGLGKIAYWRNKPYTAVEYYQKAQDLNPDNRSYEKQIKKISEEFRWFLKVKLQIIDINASIFEINAIGHRYKLRKRFNDHLGISIRTFQDHSERTLTGSPAQVWMFDDNKTNWWYDDTEIKTTFYFNDHELKAYLGGSNSASQLTSYGLQWQASWSLGKLKMQNTLKAGYKYFYYWNEVGHDHVSEDLKISYRRLTLNGGIQKGEIRPNSVFDPENDWALEQLDNPYRTYFGTLKYQLFKDPDLKLGVKYTFRDYRYPSPVYWTPEERSFIAATGNIYYPVGDLYLYAGGMYGEDSNDISNWNATIEAGHNFGNLSVGLGGTRFKNPFYNNARGNVMINYKF